MVKMLRVACRLAGLDRVTTCADSAVAITDPVFPDPRAPALGVSRSREPGRGRRFATPDYGDRVAHADCPNSRREGLAYQGPVVRPLCPGHSPGGGHQDPFTEWNLVAEEGQ